MPVINPHAGSGAGSIAYGFGTIAIDGSVPAALSAFDAGGARWYSTTVLFYANNTAGSRMQFYNTSTLAVTNVPAPGTTGANFTGAGNSVWAKWLSGTGVDTGISSFSTLPNASLIEVSEAGIVAVVTNAATGSGLATYDEDGNLLISINTVLAPATLNCRYGWLSYLDSGGWHVVDATTGDDHPTFAARANVSLCMPVEVGSDLWVFEYETSSAEFSLRNVATGKGWIVATGATTGTNVDFFWPDGRPHPTTGDTIRLAGSLTAGEAAADLIVLDVNLSAGTTSRGTVSGGVIVYTTGPTLTAATFPTTAANSQVPPYRQPVIDEHSKLASREWLAYWNKTAALVQANTTAINNLPPGGGGGGGGGGSSGISFGHIASTGQPTVSATISADTFNIESVDGVTLDPFTKTVTLTPFAVYDAVLTCYVKEL